MKLNYRTRPHSLIKLALFFAALVPAFVLLGCESTGIDHIEETGVEVQSSKQFKILFSEAVGINNNLIKEDSGQDYFILINLNTGDTVPLSTVSPSGQEISLNLQEPHVLVAAYRYKIIFDVAEAEGDVRGKGSLIFTANYSPGSDWLIDPLAAVKDSSGDLLLAWTPDRRIGNISIKVLKKEIVKNQIEDTVLLASLDPGESVYWLDHDSIASTGVSFEVQAINPYGESAIGAWTLPSTITETVDTSLTKITSMDTVLLIRTLNVDTVKYLIM